jgi:lipoyl-dependent peroxiredoxin
MGVGLSLRNTRRRQHRIHNKGQELRESKERTMQGKTETGNGEVIYTTRTRTIGGRGHGHARSCDGNLDVKLAMPGSPRIGTNPEQLFAAGWSACFESAIALAARKSQVNLGEVTIDAEVDLHVANRTDYFLSARLNISIPGIDRTLAQDLVQQAEQLCPYSKATRGNIDVTYTVV